MLGALQAAHAEVEAKQAKHYEVVVLLRAGAHLIHRAASATDQRQLFRIRPDEHPIPDAAIRERLQGPAAGRQRLRALALPKRAGPTIGFARGSTWLRLLTHGRAAGRVLVFAPVLAFLLCPILDLAALPLFCCTPLTCQLVVVLLDAPSRAELSDVVDDEVLRNDCQHILRGDLVHALQFDASVEVVTVVAAAEGILHLIDEGV
mmetsp:Transcript_55714/g.180892  ORF Transcript_55714/g.180892 Transcript_55714/m.180892 type:complete len:205 (+) Transcript_55714:1460-2074(+)